MEASEDPALSNKYNSVHIQLVQGTNAAIWKQGKNIMVNVTVYH
jgi:hypothetical protein